MYSESSPKWDTTGTNETVLYTEVFLDFKQKYSSDILPWVGQSVLSRDVSFVKKGPQ